MAMIRSSSANQSALLYLAMTAWNDCASMQAPSWHTGLMCRGIFEGARSALPKWLGGNE